MYPLEIRQNRDAAKPLPTMTCRPARAACSLTAPTVNVSLVPTWLGEVHALTPQAPDA